MRVGACGWVRAACVRVRACGIVRVGVCAQGDLEMIASCIFDEPTSIISATVTPWMYAGTIHVGGSMGVAPISGGCGLGLLRG